MLDNMPNFQAGAVKAVGRFSFEMLDQIARRRGWSGADPDLGRASGFQQYPPDIWVFDLSRSMLPTVSSESRYCEGLIALERYNARLSAGGAIFERRADTLAGTLSRIAADRSSPTTCPRRASTRGGRSCKSKKPSVSWPSDETSSSK